MDISFYCGKCGLHILVPEEGKGMGAVCPSCSAELIVPLESVPKREPPPEPEPPASTGLPWAVAGVAVVLLIVVGVLFYSSKTKTAALQQASDQLRQTSVTLNQRLTATEQLKTQLQADLEKANQQIKDLDSATAQLNQDKLAVEQKLTQAQSELDKSRQALKDFDVSIARLRADKIELEKSVAQNEQLRALAESQLAKVARTLTELQAENEKLRIKDNPQPVAPIVPPAPAK